LRNDDRVDTSGEVLGDTLCVVETKHSLFLHERKANQLALYDQSKLDKEGKNGQNVSLQSPECNTSSNTPVERRDPRVAGPSVSSLPFK
jgi:hypothetical protein